MDSRYVAPAVAAALGATAGRVSAALRDFVHPGTDRDSQWDLTHAGAVVDALAHHVRDGGRRAHVLTAAAEADAHLGPVASRLRTQVIHGDITDNNVVFARGADGRGVPQGVIDFGDLMTSWRVAELAVLCTSLLHHHGASPATVLPAVRAFHEECPLSEDEAAALWPLIVLRGATLVVSGHEQMALNPANSYALEGLAREELMLDVSRSLPIEVGQAAVMDVTGYGGARRLPTTGGSVIIPEVAADIVAVDLSVVNDALHPGRWEQDGIERDTIRHAVDEGRSAVVTRWGEARLTRAVVDRTEDSATVALGIEVHTAGMEDVLAPWAGTLRQVGADTLVLQGDGASLVLGGLTPVRTGDVAAGELVGTTVAEVPLWVQHAFSAQLPPRFVSPVLGAAWLALCPDPTELVIGHPRQPSPSEAALLQRRAEAYAAVQEHYFVDPPQIEVGWRHHLVDVSGQSYVDMINNVTLLGHGHPRLADAVADQWRRLNTNSRFHYTSVVELSERLVALLPDELDTVFLVNSGSEANDLALRLAWAATGRRDVVTVDEAYHGWTDATDAVSTSEADNPGARASRPPWVHPVRSPNVFRGPHRADPGRYAHEAVAEVQALVEAGRAPAAFICEPVYGNAGGLPLPDDYLPSVYGAVRRCGGLCIADEVQVGYGRLGDWFWGFEQQGVVPDIVTVAKGMGNGHPLGAVITSRAVADAYRSQGYFFSSAGGSPVSSTVGLTVLDVLEDERLQENARVIGEHLRRRLGELADRHRLIGAIHGFGLYLGVELVRDRSTLEPAPEETLAICERLRELGVIVQPTSDRQNVLKIKPPMCLTRASADRFVDALDETLTHGW
jgi:4-aminobutyrate aminotransferase-like enzyme